MHTIKQKKMKKNKLRQNTQFKHMHITIKVHLFIYFIYLFIIFFLLFSYLLLLFYYLLLFIYLIIIFF